MVKVQANVSDNDRAVDVKLTMDGVAIDILEESAAIIKSLYDDISEHENLVEPFVATIGSIVLGWMRDINTKDDGGKNYA